MSEHVVWPHGRLYPILSEEYLAPAELPEAAAALAQAGVGILQLRLKTLADREALALQRQVARRLASWPGVLVVNDRADLAHLLQREAAAQQHRHTVGLHLGQDDLSPAAARAIVGPAVAIGFSTHSLEQVRAALAEPVDYLAFGPIFDTATKQRPDATVGLDLLEAAARLAGAQARPLVAIGGIDCRAVAGVLERGAAAVALISALLQDGLAGLARRLQDLNACLEINR